MTGPDRSPLRRHRVRFGALLALLTGLVVATVLALALTPSSRGAEGDGLLPPQFLSPLRTDATPIHVRLSGQDYYIPANYFDSPLEPGLDQQDILLVALLPHLEARTEANWDEFMRVPGWGRRVYMLARSQPFPSDILDQSLQIYQRNSSPLEDVGSQFGLRHLRGAGSEGWLRRRDIFIDESDGSIDGIITCRFYEDYPSPGCNHDFIHGDSLVKLSYGRDNVIHWQTIHTSITSLLERFRMRRDSQDVE